LSYVVNATVVPASRGLEPLQLGTILLLTDDEPVNALETPYGTFEPNEGVTALMSPNGPVSHTATYNLVEVDELLVDGESYTLNVDFIIVKDVIPESITFRIYALAQTGVEEYYDETYTVSLGTTWAEWVEEVFDENAPSNGNWTITAEGKVYFPEVYFTSGAIALKDSNGNYVKGTDVIKSGLYTDGVNTPKVTFRIYAKTGAEEYYDVTFTVANGTTWAEFCENSYAEGLGDYAWNYDNNGRVYSKVNGFNISGVTASDVIESRTYS
jgi:hypothetical protein